MPKCADYINKKGEELPLLFIIFQVRLPVFSESTTAIGIL